MIVLVAFVLHLLIAYRLTRTSTKRRYRVGLPALLTALFLLMAIVPISWRVPITFMPNSWWPTIRVLSFLAMGTYSMIFSYFVVREATWLVLRISRTLPVDPERRQILAHGLNLGVLGAATATTAIGYREARQRAKVVDVDVPIADLPDGLVGLTIVQLSDVHVGHTIRRDYIQAIVDRVNELDADLIAITGDLIDGSVPDLTPDIAPIGELRSRLGTYFCTGNHEYYAGALEWIAHLETLGVTTLINEHVVLEHGGAAFLLAGVPDWRMGRYLDGHKPDAKKSIAGAPSVGASILLAHQPRAAFDSAEAGFDLQLAGHTHGGQFFPWNFVVGLVHPFVAGLERVGRMWIYVSRGTGYFGPPLRLFAPSEITRLRLVRAP